MRIIKVIIAVMIVLAFIQTVSATCTTGGQTGTTINIGNCQNLTDLNTLINNATSLQDLGSGEWLLNAGLVNNLTTNTFYVNDTDVTWLKINSTGTSDFVFTSNAKLEISNTKITSWNTTTTNVEPYSNTVRSSIWSTGASAKLNVSNSNISYLGYNSGNYFGVTYDSCVGCYFKNNTVIGNYRGITLVGGSYINVTNNTITMTTTPINVYSGIHIGATTFANVSSNIIYNDATGAGIRISGVAATNHDNTIYNNTVIASGAGYGIIIESTTYNNTVIGGSYSSLTGNVYYVSTGTNGSNTFNNTNFSVARTINFNDNLSTFTYDNGTGVWLKTKVVNSPTTTAITTRSLLNWTNTNLSWSETFTVTGKQMLYNVSGLKANTYYNVYNDTVINYTYQTDASGVLTPFQINFTTTAKIATVLQDIIAPAQVTGLVNDTPTQSTINISWTANTESDLWGYQIFRNNTIIGNVTTNYYNDTGLSANTLYNYIVRANDTANNWGTNSSTLGVTTSSEISQEELAGYYCTNSTTWESKNYSVTGNITVAYGCELHIENSTIEMNVSYDLQYEINVNANGKLFINNSNITSKNKYWHALEFNSSNIYVGTDLVTNNSRIILKYNSSHATERPGLYVENSTFSYLGAYPLEAASRGAIIIYNDNNYQTSMTDSYINGSILEYMSNGVRIGQHGHLNITNTTFRYFSSRDTTNTTNGIDWYYPHTSVPSEYKNLVFHNFTANANNEIFSVDKLSNSTWDNFTLYNNFIRSTLHEWNFYSGFNDSTITNINESWMRLFGFNNYPLTSNNLTIRNVTANNIMSGLSFNYGSKNITVSNWTSIRTSNVDSNGYNRTGGTILGYGDGGTMIERLNLSDFYWKNQVPFGATTRHTYIFRYHAVSNSTWKNITFLNVNGDVPPWRQENSVVGTNGIYNNTFENVSIIGEALRSGTSWGSLVQMEQNTNYNIFRDWYLQNNNSNQDIELWNNITGNYWINVRDEDKVNITGTLADNNYSSYEKYSYVDINVTNSTGFPISVATITITTNSTDMPNSIDRNGNVVASYTTDASGHTKLPIGNNTDTVVLPDYYKNYTGTYDVLSTLIVSASGYTTNSTVTISPTSGFYRARGSENTYQNSTQVTLFENYTISGYVLHNVWNNGVNRTTISNGSYSGTANVTGYYIINNIPFGKVLTLSASRYGFSTNNSVVVTVSSNLTNQNITMTPARITSAFQGEWNDVGCTGGKCGIIIYTENASNITEVDATINNESALYNELNGVWLLNNSIMINLTGTTFNLNNTDVTWLKMDDYPRLENGGWLNAITVGDPHDAAAPFNTVALEISNTKITSWNITNNNVNSLTHNLRRPYINAVNHNSTINVSNSNISYLGFWSDECFGLSYKEVGVPSFITNSTFINNEAGITIEDGSHGGITITNNTIIDTITTTSSQYGILLTSDVHDIIISDNNITARAGSGIKIMYATSNSGLGSYNNTLTNNTIYCSASGCASLDIRGKSYNNTISGGSITSASDGYAYYILDSNLSNRFNNTNFTGARRIYLNDNTSVFEYDNGTGVWLKTQPIISPTAATTVARTINNWTQLNTSWSETFTTARQIRYNVSGLLPNTPYIVYNDSIIDYNINSNEGGVLTPFTINFSTSTKTVKLLQSSTSSIVIPSNSWGMFNNWSVNTNFSSIATNESNDVAYTFYNVTSGEWDSYYPGYSWNSDNTIDKNNSVMGFFNAQTTITANTVTPWNTSITAGWNMLYLMGTVNRTLTEICTNMVNCTDIYYFNSTTNDYVSSGTDTIQPNQGFLAYVNHTETWIRSTI